MNVRVWSDKWAQTFLLGIAIGSVVAAAGWWVYDVSAHIEWGEARSAALNAVDKKQTEDIQSVRDASWSLLWWARAVSKQNGWPEPPDVPGLVKPAAMVIPPVPHPSRIPGWIDLYAAEPDRQTNPIP